MNPIAIFIVPRAVWQCLDQWAITTCRGRVGWLNKHPTWRRVGSWILGLFELEALHGGILQRTAPSLIGTLRRVLDPSTSLQAGRQASHHNHLPDCLPDLCCHCFSCVQIQLCTYLPLFPCSLQPPAPPVWSYMHEIYWRSPMSSQVHRIWGVG